MGGKAQKPLLSLEEALFIVSRWEGEIGGVGRLLRAALMLGCLFALCFLDPHRGAGTLSCGRAQQDGQQQPADRMAADGDNWSGRHQLKAKQG